MLRDLGRGVWHWELAHPEWRKTSIVVGCYAVRDGDATVLIDPLLDDQVAAELDDVADTLTFGDRIIGVDGGLRIWAQRPLSTTHRENLRTWLEPLTRIDAIDRILTTHGGPVLEDGRAALAEALTAEPVDY